MKTSTALSIFAAILIVGGGTWWYLSQNSPAPQGATVINSNTGGSASAPPAGEQATTTTGTAKTVTIHFTSQGFSPASVTVNKGDTVKFVSTDGSPMWIGSDVHPTHAQYDGTSRTTHCAPGYTGPTPFDECGTGSTYSFTFDKTGTFNFHNHVAAQFQGSVVVK